MLVINNPAFIIIGSQCNGSAAQCERKPGSIPVEIPKKFRGRMSNYSLSFESKAIVDSMGAVTS